ncbi:MAG: hypothetical protein JW862_06875, partial [Anaerolineales bacterium]|nr:hypothetical protein [Anaerolineales bacterium]
AIANRFAEETLWDEFLAYHYTGNNFEAGSRGTTIPPAGTPVRAPGSGPIELTNFTISSQTASSAQPVSLSVDIAGDRIGYIYLLAGYYDPLANSIYLIDSDYLESAETRQVDGVYYPVWGSGDFTLRFTWEPVVFGISDGNQTAVARLKPESYGASYEQALYSVDGIYRFADGSADRYARLYFSDGILRQVFGFTGSEGTGAPREIIPQAGDQFTILEEWLDLDANGQVVGRASQEGATLTFGQQPFLWQALDAAAGNYMLGFIVEDLDGIPTEIYTQVSVE